jgi:outer membrane protein assembly factor BamB
MGKKNALGLILLLALRPFGAFAPAQESSAQKEEVVQIWRGALPGAVAAAPVVEAGSVTLICEGGGLAAYGVSGTPLWNFSAGGRSSPFISRSPEGMVYIGRTNGVFIALNRVGREVWRIALGAPLAAPAIVGRDGRLLLFTTARIVCVTASGTVLWRRNLASAPAFSPRITRNGSFIAALHNGELLEVSPFGRVRTQKLEEAPVEALPLEDGSFLIFMEDGRADLVPGFGIEGPAYSFPRLESPPAAAAVRGRNAALILRNGKTLLLAIFGDAISGDAISSNAISSNAISGDGGGSDARRTGPGLRWTREPAGRETTGRDDAAIVYDDRGIHVLTKTMVTVFNVDGEETLRFRLPRPAAAPPTLSEAGTLYSGGTDWILYAYRLGSASKEPAPGRISYQNAYGTADPRLENPEEYPYGFMDEEIRRALRDIKRNVASGAIGNAEWLYLGYLMEVSTNLGRDTRVSAARRRIEPFDPILLTHRRAALELLGRLGSRETIPFLVGLYHDDPDPLIKAGAAEAIGRIGVDPGGNALRAFGNLIYGPVAYRNEQVLIATAAATGALCRFSGPPLSETGIRLLTALETRDRPQTVRRRAARELDTLRNYR